MLVGAFLTFTLVAIMGLLMAGDVWKGVSVGSFYPRLHAGAALVGSGLVIAAAFIDGDTRLYNNIGLAVVIIGLGLYMGFCAKKGKPVPKGILAAHAGLAVICYLLLVAYTFNIKM